MCFCPRNPFPRASYELDLASPNLLNGLNDIPKLEPCRTRCPFLIHHAQKGYRTCRVMSSMIIIFGSGYYIFCGFTFSRNANIYLLVKIHLLHFLLVLGNTCQENVIKQHIQWKENKKFKRSVRKLWNHKLTVFCRRIEKPRFFEMLS